MLKESWAMPGPTPLSTASGSQATPDSPDPVDVDMGSYRSRGAVQRTWPGAFTAAPEGLCRGRCPFWQDGQVRVVLLSGAGWGGKPRPTALPGLLRTPTLPSPRRPKGPGGDCRAQTKQQRGTSVLSGTLPASPASQQPTQAQTPLHDDLTRRESGVRGGRPFWHPGGAFSLRGGGRGNASRSMPFDRNLSHLCPQPLPPTLSYSGSSGPGTSTDTFYFFLFLFSKVVESGKIWPRGAAFHIQSIFPLVFSGLASPTGEGTPHLSAGEGGDSESRRRTAPLASGTGPASPACQPGPTPAACWLRLLAPIAGSPVWLA